MVPGSGIEPLTFCSSDRRCYQLSYPGMAGRAGLEPAGRISALMNFEFIPLAARSPALIKLAEGAGLEPAGPFSPNALAVHPLSRSDIPPLAGSAGLEPAKVLPPTRFPIVLNSRSVNYPNRTVWDSNPRGVFQPYRFSRPVP